MEGRVPAKFLAAVQALTDQRTRQWRAEITLLYKPNSMDWEEKYYTGSRASSPFAFVTNSRLLAREVREMSAGVALI